jgi:hypothetical protein
VGEPEGVEGDYYVGEHGLKPMPLNEWHQSFHVPFPEADFKAAPSEAVLRPNFGVPDIGTFGVKCNN